MTTQIDKKTQGHIVVGVDGSESSKAALRWAAQLAPLADGTIEAVIAWEYPTLPIWEGGIGIPNGWPLEDGAKKILKEVLADVFGKTLPKGLVSSVRQGHPAAVLLEASKNAKMLIVGSRGHGGFVGLLLGSVSSACVKHATCPVLVVHGEHI